MCARGGVRVFRTRIPNIAAILILLPLPQQLRSLIFLSGTPATPLDQGQGLASRPRPRRGPQDVLAVAQTTGVRSGILCIPSCCHLQENQNERESQSADETRDWRQETTVMISYLANCWPDNDSVCSARHFVCISHDKWPTNTALHSNGIVISHRSVIGYIYIERAPSCC